MSQDWDAELLSVGYAYHSRPYHQVQREGLSSYLFRLQTDGLSRALVDGALAPVVPGDLLLYPPGAPYELHIDADLQENGDLGVSSADYYLFCRGPWLDDWWRQSPKPTKLNLPSNADIVHMLRHMIVEQRREDPVSRSITVHLLKALCLMIGRNAEEQATHPHGKASFLAYRMKNYIEEHATIAFTLSDVAQHAGLSISRAVHLYKEVFGKSIMQHAQDLRLATARERILFSPMSLEQVAEASGFGSYSYFHRMFRSRFGMSPREFRLAHSAELELP